MSSIPRQYVCGGLWESRLPFHEEAGNIGSEPIAMTVLQQENRVYGAAKKAVAHQRQDELTQGGDGASVEGVQPCLV